MGLVAVGVNRVFRTQVERKFGYGVALAYLVLTMCQVSRQFFFFAFVCCCLIFFVLL